MTETAAEPSLQQLFWASSQHADICMLAVLTWIAACDGTIAPQEYGLLKKIAEQRGAGAQLHDVIEVAKLAKPDDLEMACHFLRAHFDRGQRRSFMRLAVTMAIQDGHLTVSENHILQFLADLFDISPRGLSKLFNEIAHRPLPVPGDPSSIAWWRDREAGREAQAPQDNWGPDHRLRAPPPEDPSSDTNQSQAPPPAARPLDRIAALSVLGLPANASPDVIHAAFRRLAKKRHPDRFAQLGPAAVAGATEAFQKLREAYELLAPG